MNIALFIFVIYVVAVMQMHYRGKVRFSAARQLLTHTNYLAPYNLLMNLFSVLPNKPLLNVDDLDELKVLRDNWEVIRDFSREWYDSVLNNQDNTSVLDKYKPFKLI